LNNWDSFAAPAPAFNIGGKAGIGTWIGFFCTVMLTMMMGFFSWLKFK
jgi:hypothetical protein